jgi:hypothetical protein
MTVEIKAMNLIVILLHVIRGNSLVITLNVYSKHGFVTENPIARYERKP